MDCQWYLVLFRVTKTGFSVFCHSQRLVVVLLQSSQPSHLAQASSRNFDAESTEPDSRVLHSQLHIQSGLYSQSILWPYVFRHDGIPLDTPELFSFGRDP
jgi:hypothetical protein